LDNWIGIYLSIFHSTATSTAFVGISRASDRKRNGGGLSWSKIILLLRVRSNLNSWLFGEFG
jgi:hypothetical protein